MEAVPGDGPPQQDRGAGLRDTIPSSLKHDLFADRSPPDLCAEYDVLGFDADHCLVKYNLPNLTRLLAQITSNDLVELCDYPEEIRDVPESLSGIALNFVVWDIEHRTLLKLGEGKVVTQAFRGSKRLQQAEIEAIYGSPAIFEPMNYPVSYKNLAQMEGAYWTLMTYFDCCKVPVIAHGLDLLERGVITGKTDLEFANDIIKSVLRQYVHFSNQEHHSIATYGHFFPTVIQDPSQIIEYQPELRRTLEELRARGTKLFLGTNSHFQYMNVIMKATLGDDWQQLFDLNIANCRKPIFFSGDSPFYPVDQSARDLRGPAIRNGAEVQQHQCCLEGNAKLVTQFYQRLLGKEQVRVCYFGDHFWSDVHASATHQSPGQPKWDAIAVVEELYCHDRELCEGADPLLNDMTEFWGSNFFFDTVNGVPVKNYFVREVEKVARYAVPMTKHIKSLFR